MCVQKHLHQFAILKKENMRCAANDRVDTCLLDCEVYPDSTQSITADIF